MWNNYKIEKIDKYYKVYLLDVNKKNKVTSKMWKCFNESELTEKEKQYLKDIPKFEDSTAMRAVFRIIHYEKLYLWD